MNRGTGLSQPRWWIKRHNMELQFWGYESGNILAAIGGVGGFGVFLQQLSIGASANNHSLLGSLAWLATESPDAIAVIGIGLIALLAPLLRKLAVKTARIPLINAFDLSVVFLSLAVLGFTLNASTSWITVAGASFVVASSLLRFAMKNPLFLKLGGLFLQLGGLALAVFGFIALKDAIYFTGAIFGLLTCCTGYYVFAAGGLTYLGGIFQSNELRANSRPGASGNTSLANKLLHPVTGGLSRLLFNTTDWVIANLANRLFNPSIFWVTKKDKQNQPFYTSMMARLPWRVATAIAALSIGNPAALVFALANVCWAIGDIAIGSIDWEGSATETVTDKPEELVFGFANANHLRLVRRVLQKHRRFESLDTKMF